MRNTPQGEAISRFGFVDGAVRAMNSKFDHAKYSGLAGNFSCTKSSASCSQGNREGLMAFQFFAFGAGIQFVAGAGKPASRTFASQGASREQNPVIV